ncbi:MAG: hypothetical protein LBN22_08585 [Clostridiales Family XIII bacterium]|jgi:hypothetical protein|nr:hypothetical protein [Clostridiales Family XIII bacterium]
MAEDDKKYGPLRVIVGGADPEIVRSKRKFIYAYVTNTRLMGVVVLYVHTLIGDGTLHEEHLHQFFYIDTVDEGIETYRGITGEDTPIMHDVEQATMGGLGGRKIEISLEDAAATLQMYADINRRSELPLPEGLEEYKYLLEMDIPYSKKGQVALLTKMSEYPQTPFAIINYFLMRAWSTDLIGAQLLMKDDVDLSIARGHEYMTLLLNRITIHKSESGSTSYLCESVLEGEYTHSIALTELKVAVIDGELKISRCEVLNKFDISPTEAAMKLERPEYLTVFELQVSSEQVLEHLLMHMSGSIQKKTDEGTLFMTFKPDNDHIKEEIYRLNDDIEQMMYLTSEDQLIVATFSLPEIHKVERMIELSPLGKMVYPVAKFEFKEDVFYDFAQSDTGDFMHYMEYISDFDTDE